MGLDINVYTNLTPYTGTLDKDGYPTENNVVRIYNSDWFIGREHPFILNQLYIGDDMDDLGFRAGSYSGYGEWREQLATLAGYEKILTTPSYREPYLSACASARNKTSGPFYELINFSDCEGILGTTTCLKLAKDFAEYQILADKIKDTFNRFNDLYSNWRIACEIAGNHNGCIQFR